MCLIHRAYMELLLCNYVCDEKPNIKLISDLYDDLDQYDLFNQPQYHLYYFIKLKCFGFLNFFFHLKKFHYLLRYFICFISTPVLIYLFFDYS